MQLEIHWVLLSQQTAQILQKLHPHLQNDQRDLIQCW